MQDRLEELRQHPQRELHAVPECIPEIRKKCFQPVLQIQAVPHSFLLPAKPSSKEPVL